MPYMQIEQLKIHPINDKIYDQNDAQDEELLDLIRANGIKQPIEVNTAGFIVSGNRRYRCAIKLGFQKVPVSVRHFKNFDEEIAYLILANAYRVKSNEEKIREGKKLEEIYQKTAVDGRVRDKVGEAIGMSGRTFQKGSDVVEKIDQLEQEGHPEKAKKLRDRMNKSIDGAAKEAETIDDEEDEPTEMDLDEAYSEAVKQASEKRFFFYVKDLKLLLREMEIAYRRLSGKRDATTPAALGHMIGNIEEMRQRLNTWLPELLENCPECSGTGKLATNGESDKAIPCGYCLNGKVGLHKHSKL